MPVAAIAIEREQDRGGQRAVRHESAKVASAENDHIRNAHRAGDVSAGGFRADVQTATPEQSSGFAQ